MWTMAPGDAVTRHADYPTWLAAHGGWYEDTLSTSVSDDARTVTVRQLRLDAKGRPFLERDELASKVNSIALARPVPGWLRAYMPIHLEGATA